VIPCERWEVENIVVLGPLLRFAHRNDDTFHVMWNWVEMAKPFINVKVVFDGSIVDGCVVGSGSDGLSDGTYSFRCDSRYRYSVKTLFLFLQDSYQSWSLGSS
jgi:hypothetical protein